MSIVISVLADGIAGLGGAQDGNAVILAGVSLEIVIDGHSETAFHHWSEHHLGLGVQRIADSGPQVEQAVAPSGRVWLHIYAVGRELVRAPVGIVKNGIVEIPVELEKGVGHGHRDVLLVDFHKFALVVVGHLDRRVEILGGRRRAGEKG